ncbi:hypothetical protein [Vibrio aestuarianus]|uniref:Uncharacterized protein n=1 Tax=Vibrio aestuarianus TaxID=28171 RepID=A0ABD7YHV1_9VIBR|nr:hypothetical protein [Vibrio aestuarianus]MDE1330227.1 hypothetical protein [Vibrio aestuarianus]WGK84462.1 hypothetical protein PYE67_08600 [Vibrio aestuarianus]CAH8201512.1 exported hypothetical protein [Vibrio aestuarianus]
MKNIVALSLVLSSSFSAHAGLIEINEYFTLFTPEPYEKVYDAVENGLDINIIDVKIDGQTNIGYAILNSDDTQKYCDYRQKRSITISEHDLAYTTLLSNNDSVINYGWPFAYLPIAERFSAYFDGSGDMISGLRSLEPRYGLVVCRNKF